VSNFVVVFEHGKSGKVDLALSDEMTVPEAIKKVRTENARGGGVVITAVFRSDDEMTNLCQLHGNELPCEICDSLSEGRFPSTLIDLDG
jgi:hypothetical protein